MIKVTFDDVYGMEKTYVTCELNCTVDGYTIIHPETGEALKTPITKENSKEVWIKKVVSMDADVPTCYDGYKYYTIVDNDTMELLGYTLNELNTFFRFAEHYVMEHEIQLIPIATTEDNLLLVERVHFQYDKNGGCYRKI